MTPDPRYQLSQWAELTLAVMPEHEWVTSLDVARGLRQMVEHVAEYRVVMALGTLEARSFVSSRVRGPEGLEERSYRLLVDGRRHARTLRERFNADLQERVRA